MEILFITQVGLGILSYFVNRRDLMAPTNMVCAVFVIGTIAAWTRKLYWQYDYSQYTTVVIASSIGCMIAGSILGDLLVRKLLKNGSMDRKSQRNNWYEPVTPSIALIILVTVFAVFTSWMFYKDIYAHAISYDPELDIKDFTSVGSVIKKLSADGEFHFLKYNAWLQYLRKGLAYGCIYLYMDALKGKGINTVKRSYILLPVIPFLFCCYVTGLRTEFIFIVAYTVTVFGVRMMGGSTSSWKQYVKAFAGAVIAVCLMMAIWAGTYMVRHHITAPEQIDEEVLKSMWNNFAVYSGGGIVELDVFLKNPPAANGIFGFHTLQNVYSKLNRLGMNCPDIGLHIYEMTTAGNLVTNIFTAFRRYIEDYGMMGNYVICIALGCIYSVYYRLARIKEKNPLYLMTYASLIFPLFVMASEDYFFMYLVDTTPLYICGFIILAWFILCNSDKIIKKVFKQSKEKGV